MQEGDIIQSARLYIFMDGKLRWVKTGEIFNKMGLDWKKRRVYLADEEIQKLRGKDITEWPENPDPPPNQTYEVRPMFIIDTCNPNAPVEDYPSMGITAVKGNHEYYPHYDRCKEAGIKPIICINVYHEGTNYQRPFRDTDVPHIEERVRYWVNYFGPGGVIAWWSSGSRGEEPDAVAWGYEEYAEVINESRRLFYKTIRRVRPNPQTDPVIEQFDLTNEGIVGGEWREGWQRMWLDKESCDVVLFDCYVRNCLKQQVWDDIHKYYEAFPGKFCSKHIQLIPCLTCQDYRPNIFHDLVWAYKDCIGPKMGLAFYSDILLRPQEDAQQEIKEVISECMSSF